MTAIPLTMDREDAEALARNIRHFWAERGFRVQASVVKSPDPARDQNPRFIIRTDLRNGLPRGFKRTHVSLLPGARK
jgi:hypothetical protein